MQRKRLKVSDQVSRPGHPHLCGQRLVTKRQHPKVGGTRSSSALTAWERKGGPNTSALPAGSLLGLPLPSPDLARRDGRPLHVP